MSTREISRDEADRQRQVELDYQRTMGQVEGIAEERARWEAKLARLRTWIANGGLECLAALESARAGEAEALDALGEVHADQNEACEHWFEKGVLKERARWEERIAELEKQNLAFVEWVQKRVEHVEHPDDYSFSYRFHPLEILDKLRELGLVEP